MDLLDVLKEYWSIILFIGGGIVLAVRQEGKVKELIDKDHQQQAHIDKLDTKIDITHSRIEKMEQHIVEIKTILQFLRDKK